MTCARFSGSRRADSVARERAATDGPKGLPATMPRPPAPRGGGGGGALAHLPPERGALPGFGAAGSRSQGGIGHATVGGREFGFHRPGDEAPALWPRCCAGACAARDVPAVSAEPLDLLGVAGAPWDDAHCAARFTAGCALLAAGPAAEAEPGCPGTAPLTFESDSPAALLRERAANCSMLSRDDLSAVPRAACCSAANFAASSALAFALAFCKAVGGTLGAFATRFCAGGAIAIPTLPRAGGPLSTSIGAGCGLEALDVPGTIGAEPLPGCPGGGGGAAFWIVRGVRGTMLANAALAA